MRFAAFGIGAGKTEFAYRSRIGYHLRSSTVFRSSFVRYIFGLAFLIGLLALSHSGQAAGDNVPNLHIERSCRDAESSIGSAPDQTYKNCLADETEARATLVKKWSQFKPATRSNCIEAGATPSPSYVELLTCLEMFNEILMPRAADTPPAKK
jgi:hypothetical protein